jgi:hemerythrin-like domain-containing protein
MNDIKDYMTRDHRRCDEHFAVAEEAVSNGDWEKGEAEFNGFREAMEHHFNMEENALFPELEEATGITQGPTAVMRSEHEEMRHLFEQMALAVEGRYEDEYLDASETLLVMMQQHNMKEEQMLYEMADRQLGPEAAAVLERMQNAG